MEPTLRQIRYAVALAEHRNFRRAAEACYVSQPALSAGIQQLEKGFGTPLFERGAEVMPTPAGEAFLLHAQRVLLEVEDLVGATIAARQPLGGRLRVGLIPTIAPYLLPPVLPRLTSTYPDLRLLLFEGQTSELVRKVRDGELDLAILALEAELGGLETAPLKRDPFLLALPPGHPASGWGQIAEADLSGLEGQILLLEDGHCLRDQALAICEEAAVKGRLDFRASSMATLLQMVAAGGGFTLVPELVVHYEAAHVPDVAFLPFRGTPPYRTIGMAWRPSSPRKKELRLLHDALAGSLEESLSGTGA